VALIAGLWEVRRYVIRIRCALEVLKVAGHASRAVQRVVIVGVAVGALPRRHGVRARQREAGRGVVKLRVSPKHGVVALLAGRRKSGMRHWGGRPVVVVLVATDARGGGDVVVVADVAIGALSWGHSVRSGQRKSGLGVIKSRRLPGGCVVAGLAGLRESAADVIRIRRALEILQVARYTRGAGQVVVVVHVAVGALSRRYGMRARQGEVDQRVIEAGRRPSRRGMALGAVGGEVGRDVIGIRRTLKIFEVTTNAGRAAQVVDTISVTVGTLARRNRMSTRQRESDGTMIEFCIQPTIRAVATLARGGEFGSDVVGTDGGLKVGVVTGRTSRGHRLELTIGGAFLAGIAVHRRMGARQHEAVVVLLDLLNRDLPSPDRVTLLAVGSQLPLVDVGMAILAALSYIRENRLHMTLRAGHGLVHAAQGISRPVVIEFRNGADRRPPVRGVTILARNIQVSVRTMCPTRNLRPGDPRKYGKRQQGHCH